MHKEIEVRQHGMELWEGRKERKKQVDMESIQRAIFYPKTDTQTSRNERLHETHTNAEKIHI